MDRSRTLRLSALTLAIILVALSFACTKQENTVPAPISTPAPTLTPSTEKTPKPQKTRLYTKFSEMEYNRPSAENAAAAAQKLCESLGSFASLDELEEEFNAVDEMYLEYDKMYALAMIHASMDRSDEYWVEEERALTTGYPAMDKASGELMIALYTSEFKEQIEDEWDESFFKYIDKAYFTNEVTKPLFEREAAIESIQKERLAMASIDYEGEQLTYNDIQEMTDYIKWMRASLKWYDEYNEEFALRYIELIKIRNAIAENLGFKSYSDYVLRYRNKDYTTNMMKKLIDDIAQELVPIYTELQKKGRYLPPVNLEYDEFLEFFSKTICGMDAKIYEAYLAMQKYELVDMQPRQYKTGGAFTMFISGYELPFVMGTYTGDLYSIITFAHEFGHFYCGYETLMDPPANNDLSEVHSQSMELFIANHLDAVFDEYVDYALLYDSLYRTFTTITGQPYYASFELEAYAMDENELTVENLNALALEQARRFGMGVYFPEYAMNDWVTVPHIYHNPLTTFGYVTSAFAAIEIWELSREDEKAAIELYKKTVQREDDTVFIDALLDAGLSSPFESGRVEAIADWANKYLMEEDME